STSMAANLSIADGELLRLYADRRDQRAFPQLIERHLDWVYSAAARITRDQTMAEDVTQGVFMVLAEKARRLSGHPAIAGWLFRATQFAAKSALKRERVRKIHEAQAMQQTVVSTEVDRYWEE